jgi:methionyl aminopeptidase
MPDVQCLTSAEADAAYAAAQRVVETHHTVSPQIREGMTLAQVDALVAKTLEALECRSCFLGYVVAGHPPFPSHACVSVNDCVVHGHAAYRKEALREGDVLKIDVGVWYRGWVVDAAWTYSIGEPRPEVRKLMESGKVSLARGIETMRVGRPYIEWARAVQDCVEGEFGFRCIENWGGHGIGKKVDEKSKRGLHLPPHLLNHRPKAGSPWEEANQVWRAGNLVAVEPMIAVGTGRTHQRKFAYNPRQQDWPVYTDDGSLSVHYEHDVLITDAGPRVLTAGLEELKDVVG